MPDAKLAMHANYPLSGEDGAPTLSEGECAVLVFYNDKNALEAESGTALIRGMKRPNGDPGLELVLSGSRFALSSKDWRLGHRWIRLPSKSRIPKGR